MNKTMSLRGGACLPGQPKNIGYLYRGLFLVILAFAWVLYEQGTITSLFQIVGYLLVFFGFAVVVITLITPRDGLGEVPA